MGKIVLYGFFYECVKFHGNLLLNVVVLCPFIGLAKMWQGFPNQNNALLDYYHSYVDWFHNIMLDWDMNHHLLQNFNENCFPSFHYDAWNLDRYWNLSNCDNFLCRP